MERAQNESDAVRRLSNPKVAFLSDKEKARDLHLALQYIDRRMSTDFARAVVEIRHPA